MFVFVHVAASLIKPWLCRDWKAPLIQTHRAHRKQSYLPHSCRRRAFLHFQVDARAL